MGTLRVFVGLFPGLGARNLAPKKARVSDLLEVRRGESVDVSRLSPARRVALMRGLGAAGARVEVSYRSVLPGEVVQWKGLLSPNVRVGQGDRLPKGKGRADLAYAAQENACFPLHRVLSVRLLSPQTVAVRLA